VFAQSLAAAFALRCLGIGTTLSSWAWIQEHWEFNNAQARLPENASSGAWQMGIICFSIRGYRPGVTARSPQTPGPRPVFGRLGVRRSAPACCSSRPYCSGGQYAGAAADQWGNHRHVTVPKASPTAAIACANKRQRALFAFLCFTMGGQARAAIE